MAITPDKDPMNIVASTIVKDNTEKVGNSIKKKIVESTVLVDPCPSPGAEILKVYDKIKKKINK